MSAFQEFWGYINRYTLLPTGGEKINEIVQRMETDMRRDERRQFLPLMHANHSAICDAVSLIEAGKHDQAVRVLSHARARFDRAMGER